MKRYVALLAAGLVALSACTAQSGPESDVVLIPGEIATGVFGTRYELYANFELPEFWSVAEAHSNEFRQVFFPGTTVLEDPSNISVEIHPTGMPADVYEEISEGFREFVEEMITMNSPTATVLAHDFIETGFGGAILTMYSDTVDGRSFVRAQYYLLVDDYLAIIVATDYDDDDSDIAANVARHIINTVEFTDIGELPPPELPARILGGEWNANVYTNEMLDLRFVLPENWEALPREDIAAHFGLEAEQLIEVMAVSDTEEIVQVFLNIGAENGVTAEGFLEGFMTQMQTSPDYVGSGEAAETVIGAHTYVSRVAELVDFLGRQVFQHTLVRQVDESTVLAITLVHLEESEFDPAAFLRYAFGE